VAEKKTFRGRGDKTSGRRNWGKLGRRKTTGWGGGGEMIGFSRCRRGKNSILLAIVRENKKRRLPPLRP